MAFQPAIYELNKGAVEAGLQAGDAFTHGFERSAGAYQKQEYDKFNAEQTAEFNKYSARMLAERRMKEQELVGQQALEQETLRGQNQLANTALQGQNSLSVLDRGEEIDIRKITSERHKKEKEAVAAAGGLAALFDKTDPAMANTIRTTAAENPIAALDMSTKFVTMAKENAQTLEAQAQAAERAALAAKMKRQEEYIQKIQQNATSQKAADPTSIPGFSTLPMADVPTAGFNRTSSGPAPMAFHGIPVTSHPTLSNNAPNAAIQAQGARVAQDLKTQHAAAGMAAPDTSAIENEYKQMANQYAPTIAGVAMTPETQKLIAESQTEQENLRNLAAIIEKIPNLPYLGKVIAKYGNQISPDMAKFEQEINSNFPGILKSLGTQRLAAYDLSLISQMVPNFNQSADVRKALMQVMEEKHARAVVAKLERIPENEIVPNRDEMLAHARSTMIDKQLPILALTKIGNEPASTFKMTLKDGSVVPGADYYAQKVFEGNKNFKTPIEFADWVLKKKKEDEQRKKQNATK